MASVVVDYSDGRRATVPLDNWSLIEIRGVDSELVVAGGRGAANSATLPIPRALRLAHGRVEVDCAPGILANTTLVPVDEESEIVVRPGTGDPVRVALEGATSVRLS